MNSLLPSKALVLFKTILVVMMLLSWEHPAWSIVSANKLWIPFTLSGNYQDFLYFVELEARFVEPNTGSYQGKNTEFDQFVSNFAGGWHTAPTWQFWLGQTVTTVAQDVISLSRTEYRLWEQIIWHGQTKKTRINSRFRAEQRKSLDFPEWAFRLRERLIFRFPLTQNMAYELSTELFYNLNRVPWIETTAWDQNRAYVAIVQTFSKNRAFAAGYMNQYLFREKPLSQSNHIFYLNFRYFLPT